jgi:putative ATPase
MKDLGYGAGYQYAHASEDAFLPQEYLPEVLRGQTWYDPTDFGFEKEVKQRLAWWAALKKKATE